MGVASDMVRRGLNWQFFDVEAFLMPPLKNSDVPRVEVMEVNCRTFSNQLPIFANMYGPKCCMFAAAVDLLAGRAPPIPANFAEEAMKPPDQQAGDIKLAVCAYYAAIPGAPVIYESDDKMAVFSSVPNYPAHVYAYGHDQKATRKLCDDFYEK